MTTYHYLPKVQHPLSVAFPVGCGPVDSLHRLKGVPARPAAGDYHFEGGESGMVSFCSGEAESGIQCPLSKTPS